MDYKQEIKKMRDLLNKSHPCENPQAIEENMRYTITIDELRDLLPMGSKLIVASDEGEPLSVENLGEEGHQPTKQGEIELSGSAKITIDDEKIRFES